MGDIFLATGLIEPDLLFKNGLHQNSLTLYNMFETMGYTCYAIVEKRGNFVPGYRFLEPEDYLRSENSYRPVIYIEIGLSMDLAWRQHLQKKGVKTVKLYLGNILNIDTETILMTPGINFHHHNAGGLDEIWTSPHYEMNMAYACAVNRLPLSAGRLVPYVWEPVWIKGLGRWQPGSTWINTDIVVMEPNISFQKCSLYPILLVNAFAAANPEWKGRLVVQNSDRLLRSRWFRERIQPLIKCPVVWKGRQTLGEVIHDFPGAAFVSHQLTNDYNYLVLELMHLGYPLLHNSSKWAGFGYNWSIDNWAKSLETLRSMLEYHAIRLGGYQSHASALAWVHSPTNPVNRSAWLRLLGA